MNIIITWPHKLDSLNTVLDFGRFKAKRRAEKERGRALVRVANALKGKTHRPPYAVNLIRFGKRRLDDDNLAAAFKHIRDGVADALGVNDGDATAVKWEYAQVLHKEYAVGVGIAEKRK